MMRLQTNIRVPGLNGREVTDFMLNCDDASIKPGGRGFTGSFTPCAGSREMSETWSTWMSMLVDFG